MLNSWRAKHTVVGLRGALCKLPSNFNLVDLRRVGQLGRGWRFLTCHTGWRVVPKDALLSCSACNFASSSMQEPPSQSS